MSNRDTDEREIKNNSYEGGKETKKTIHLEHVPKPHGYGEQITNDAE